MVRFKVLSTEYQGVPVIGVQAEDGVAVELRGGMGVAGQPTLRAVTAHDVVEARFHGPEGSMTDWVPISMPKMVTASSSFSAVARSFETGI